MVPETFLRQRLPPFEHRRPAPAAGRIGRLDSDVGRYPEPVTRKGWLLAVPGAALLLTWIYALTVHANSAAVIRTVPR